MGTGGISNRKLIKGMSKIGLEDGCMLVIRKGTELAEKVSVKQLREAIEQAGYSNIVILIADSTANIGKIPEWRLNKAGWYKIDEVGEQLKHLVEMRESEGESDD